MSARSKAHAALDQLLDAIAEEMGRPPAPRERAQRRRQFRVPARPDAEVSETDRAAADRVAKRWGLPE